MADSELDEAVRRIIELMLRDEWRAGTSHLEFARKHHVQVVTVRRWASEASRFIRLCEGDQEQIRDELLRNVRRIGGKAEEAGDNRNALAAQELRMRVHGVLDPRPTEELSEAELDALIRARGYRKDTDATEPGTTPAAERGAEDRGGERGEEKGREQGFRSEGDDDSDDT